MKTLVKIILIISIAFLISGCSWRLPWNKPQVEPVVEIIYINKYIECPKMDSPVYIRFDVDFHIGHLRNLEILRNNMEQSLRYIDSLENTIQCYVIQTKN